MTWTERLEDLARRMYAGEFDDDIDPDMVREIADQFMEVVQKGFGESFDDKGLSATDFEQLQQLEENVFHFSGAKNYLQLQEMSALLTDKGEQNTFDEFWDGVQQIDDTYNKNYARAEYQHALNTSKAISDWQTIQDEKDALPMLEWVSVMGESTCPICEGLNGTVKPVDDAFWHTCFPPRHFFCLCTTVSRPGDVAVKEPTDIVEVPPMFRSNPGITGVVFNPKAPYFQSIPHDMRNSIEKQSKALVPERKIAADRAAKHAVLSEPEHRQYRTIHENEGSGGVVNRHHLVNTKASDYTDVKHVAKVMASQGHKVEMLPEIHSKDTVHRSKILPGTKPGKNPDLRINGEYHEVETPTLPLTKKKLQRRINEGADQANHVIIKLNDKLSGHEMHSLASNALRNKPELKTVSFMHKNELEKFDRDRVK